MITTIMMVSDLAWRWIAGSEVVGFMTRLGRRSLAVYVAHVWVVAIILAAARRTEWVGAWQVVWAGGGGAADGMDGGVAGRLGGDGGRAAVGVDVRARHAQRGAQAAGRRAVADRAV